jgi:hypothetical protein
VETMRAAGRILSVAGAVLIATLGLAACSGDSPSASAPPAGGASAAAPADAGQGKAALDKSSDELHNLVKSLVTPVNGGLRPPYQDCGKVTGTAAYTCVGFDAGAPCSLDGAAWPQRWGYGVNLRLSDKEPTESGTYVVDLLRTAGWTITSGGAAVTGLDMIADKDGLSVRIVGDALPGVLDIEGYGKCIAADGSLVQA